MELFITILQLICGLIVIGIADADQDCLIFIFHEIGVGARISVDFMTRAMGEDGVMG